MTLHLVFLQIRLEWKEKQLLLSQDNFDTSFNKMEVIHGCEQDLSSTLADIAKILSLHIWEEQLQPLVLKQESSRLDDGRDPRVRAGLVLHLRGHHPPHWQAQTCCFTEWGSFIVNFELHVTLSQYRSAASFNFHSAPTSCTTVTLSSNCNHKAS